MKCPKCGSSETYRKNPQDLTVWCDACGYRFSDEQPQRPILSTNVRKDSSPRRGVHSVKVWLCPTDKSKYSFSVSYGTGIAHMQEFPEDPFLSGAFNTAREALEAGIRWVRGEA